MMLVLPPDVRLTERLADRAVHDYSRLAVRFELPCPWLGSVSGGVY